MSIQEKGTNAVELADDDALLREPKRPPRLPPRWFIRSFWVGHRAIYSVTGGRLGLRRAKVDQWGMLRIRTVGRRTGAERTAILGYLEDGPNLVTLAMNGWAEPEPAWWLNLLANPHARVDLAGGSLTRSTREQRKGRSGRASGRSGRSSTRAPTPTQPGDPERRRSSSWSHGQPSPKDEGVDPGSRSGQNATDAAPFSARRSRASSGVATSMDKFSRIVRICATCDALLGASMPLRR